MPSTRRRILQSLALGSTTVLAGCADDTGTTGTDTPRDGPPGPDDMEFIEDVETASLRASGSESVLESTRREHMDVEFFDVLVADADEEHLEFEREPDGIDELRGFVEATDYDDVSLFVAQRQVDECHELEFAYLEKRPDRELPRPKFCRRSRPPDVDCSIESTDTIVALVRLPVSLEEKPSSSGMGVQRSCDTPPVNGGEEP